MRQPMLTRILAEVTTRPTNEQVFEKSFWSTLHTFWLAFLDLPLWMKAIFVVFIAMGLYGAAKGKK